MEVSKCMPVNFIKLAQFSCLFLNCMKIKCTLEKIHWSAWTSGWCLSLVRKLLLLVTDDRTSVTCQSAGHNLIRASQFCQVLARIGERGSILSVYPGLTIEVYKVEGTRWDLPDYWTELLSINHYCIPLVVVDKTKTICLKNNNRIDEKQSNIIY